MYFNWVAQEAKLSAAALTVRAQTISPNDTGRLLWDVFMPRQNVDSVKIRNITTLDFRPTADRREWNLRGRAIPLKTPEFGDLEMVPIEAYFNLGEREIQDLEERTFGNQDVFRQIVGASIPERTDGLASADYRRIEVDDMSAWALGQISVRNPQTNAVYTASYGFDAGRYQTALTAWNDSGLNAFEELVSWLEDAIDAVGPIEGVMLRKATFQAIQADAPQGVDEIMLTQLQVEDRIQQRLATPFRFLINENTQDIFTTAGLATTRTKVWPAEKIAVIPAGGTVGYTAFAPVARAMQIARAVPEAAIDVRGVTMYHEVQNGGRELVVEGQVNAFPVPNEQLLFVIDVGV